jgi:hypothetical protein
MGADVGGMTIRLDSLSSREFWAEKGCQMVYREPEVKATNADGDRRERPTVAAVASTKMNPNLNQGASKAMASRSGAS